MADIVVIGGANIDIKAKANEPNRLGTSNPGVVSLSPGGVGRNIAHNLSKFGAKVSLISVVGQDANGAAVLEQTAAAGVDVAAVATAGGSTGTYVVLLDSSGEMITALSDMRAVDSITPELVSRHVAALEAARLVVADCNLSIETLLYVASLARHKLVIEPVSVPKSRKLFALLKDGPIFLASPNFDQMEELTGSRDIEHAFATLHGLGLRNAVIHAGAEGAFVSDGQEIAHVEPMPPSKIIDVTGAGDAAVAGLVYGLLKGQSLFEAAAHGQACAGRVIAANGSTL